MASKETDFLNCVEAISVMEKGNTVRLLESGKFYRIRNSRLECELQGIWRVSSMGIINFNKASFAVVEEFNLSEESKELFTHDGSLIAVGNVTEDFIKDHGKTFFYAKDVKKFIDEVKAGIDPDSQIFKNICDLAGDKFK